MRPATPMMLRYARALIALEAKSRKGAGNGRPLAFDICDRFRPHMAMLLGRYGYHAIVARSLRLASAEVPWLTTVQLLESGGWEVPDLLLEKITPEQRTEGGVVLVAHFLGLLTALMGEEVTIRQIHQVWSQRRLDDGKPGGQSV